MENLTSEHKETLEKLNLAEEKAKNKINSLERISDSLSKLEEHAKGVIGKLDAVEVKKAFMSDKLTISERDYSTLVSLAKAGESKSLENLQLKSKVGELQRKLDKSDLDEEEVKCKLKKLNEVESKYLDLQRKYIKLSKTYERVETAINKLDLVDKVNDEMKAMDLAKKRKMSFDMER